MRGLPLALLASLLATFSVGCGSKPPDDGLTRYGISGDTGDFALAVPDTWHATTSTEMQSASFEQFARENPKLAPYAYAVAGEDSAFQFFAYDPVLRKKFVTNVNVVVTPVAGDMTPEEFRSSTVAELRRIAVSGVGASDVTLPGGEAFRLEYHVQLVLEGKKREVSALQYAFLRDGNSYVLTYTTLPAFEDTYRTTFRISAESFRFTDV